MAASRRSVLGGLIGLGGASGFLASAQIAFAQSNVVPPNGPMMLTRRQERSLSDGKIIEVTRSWKIRFQAQTDAIAISGSQIAVSVEAPEALAPIAAIEEARSTDDMWPINLSLAGRIVDAGADVREQDFNAALAAAEQIIERDTNSANDQATRLDYLRRLENIGSSLLAQIPSDLFFPVGEPFQSQREVQLPDGLTGVFEVSYDARPVQQGTWLDRALRKVTTRIGESEKYALEEWSLSQV